MPKAASQVQTDAMVQIPATMRRLVAPRKTKPEGYELQDVPTPGIQEPTQVLLRVHATGINTLDVKIAAGDFDLFHKPLLALPMPCSNCVC
jgi:NADPH:quinone reductase-like Zn-dependent oxidoreductase